MMKRVVLGKDIEEVMLSEHHIVYTVDDETINDGLVTVRNRDTMAQESCNC